MTQKTLLYSTLLFLFLMGCGSPSPKVENEPSEEKTQEEEITDPFPVAAPDSSAVDTSAPVTKAEKPNMGPPIIQFETQEFVFDTLTAGDVVQFDFKFKNVGDRPLEIKNVSGSCGCTIGSWPFILIAKGESGFIKARFDSKGKKGKQESTLTVYSNAAEKEMVLKIKGFVK